MASDPERLRALKAFDDTKAGVKGLVDAGVTAVPFIFHNPPESLPPDASQPHHHEQQHFTIPVIDLAAGERAGLVAQVKAAAETVGFFQVVNHGVLESAMAGMLECVRQFHESPAEAKAPYYTRDPGRRVRYTSNNDLFQSPAANWRDTLFIQTAPAPAPEEFPPACRAVAPEYARLARELGRALFDLLSEALGLDPRNLEQECLDGLSVLGHYYPACPEPRLTMGTPRHSDPTFLTVLLQDAVGGLQVLVDRLDDEGNKQSDSAVWVDVPPVAGALVVNVGDYLQLVSNDRFRSMEHRVMASGVGPRVSVACFFRTHTSALVLAPMVTGEARYKSTTVAELMRHYMAKGLDGTSGLQHVRI